MTDVERRIAEALRGRRVLIAYGLFGEVIAAFRPVGIDYMGTQAEWLRSALGADVSVVRLPTASAVADNAERLGAELRREDRPAIVIAHSKGGLEALAALVSPEMDGRCVALLAMQSPFYGSQVADGLLASRALHRAADHALRAVKLGSGVGLHDLTTTSRIAWMQAHEAEVARLVRRIPVVCCAARSDRGAVGPERRYMPLFDWMVRRGAGPNDGLVSVESALLPGAHHIVVPGTHRSAVSKGGGRDPIGVLRQMLRLALLGEAAAAAG